MYSKEKIAIEVEGKLTSIWVKISQDFVLEVDGKQYKAICMIRSDAKDGEILFWTQDTVNKAIGNAVKMSLAKISMRATFIEDKENTQIALYRSEEFEKDDIVKHSYFGIGKVCKVDLNNNNNDQRITVLFEDGQTKRLITKFANLQVICNKDGNIIA